MVSNWQYTQDVMAYKSEIYSLKERIQNLEEIEEEHRNLNGMLRIEIASLKKHLQTHCKENI